MASSHGLGLACFALVVAAASATQFRVGGQRGWSVPDANAEPFNAWAGRMRFQIGDQLLFVYPKETDSVLVVEPGAYDACNTTSFANKFDDGSTVFTFNRPGPFFFISGNEANCRANEKLIVVVLADRGGNTPPAVSPPPASTPPSASPMPSSSTPPSAAPIPSPMLPPSGAPVPALAATPGSAPSPTASASAPTPTATPGSPPSPAALAPSPSSSPGTPGGVPRPPSASADAPPGAEGSNSTTPTTPSVNAQSGAAPVAAGLAGSLAVYIGYAMLAI